MSEHQRALRERFCPPGSEPLEAWIERLLVSNATTTARAIGLVLAHRVNMGTGNPVPINADTMDRIMVSAGLNPRHRHSSGVLRRSLSLLRDAGLIRFHIRDAQRDGVKEAFLTGIELLIAGGAK